MEKDGKNNPDDASCGICLETLINNGPITNTGCHPLREECKKDWYNASCIKAGQLKTCPVCRQIPIKDITYENFDKLAECDKTSICENSDCVLTIKKESISKVLSECPYPLSQLDFSDSSNFIENNHPILIPALKMMISRLNITIENIYYEDKYISYSRLPYLNKRHGKPAIIVETTIGNCFFLLRN